MAKKKELDKLSLDMIECKKAGYGCHYGRWKALQEIPVIEKKTDEIPEGWKTCKRCGKPFKPKAITQKYCEVLCQIETAKEKDRERHNKRQKQYRERMKAERAENES